MAAAAAKVRPPPPPPVRRTVAWLACTYLSMAAIDAVLCLFIANMWLLFWGVATMEIGRLACGEGCAVVTAADKVFSVATWVTPVLVLPLLLALNIARSEKAAAAAAAIDIEATKDPDPEETSYAAVRARLFRSLALGLLAFLAFALLKLIGVLVKGDSPVTGSRRERMGSVICDAGALGMVMVNCFVTCPILTVGLWRAWRMPQHALRCLCS